MEVNHYSSTVRLELTQEELERTRGKSREKDGLVECIKAVKARKGAGRGSGEGQERRRNA